MVYKNRLVTNHAGSALVEAYENGFNESVWVLGHARFTSNIKIQITNVETNTKYVLIPDSDGFFFSTNLPHGKYRFDNPWHPIFQSDWYGSISIGFTRPIYFEIQGKHRNNLGY